MKSQTDILSNLLEGFLLDAEKCLPGYSSDRDKREVIHRVSSHGMSFFEIILPRLDDGLLQGLSSGSLPTVLGWKKKPGTKIPEFLFGIWSRIFDHTGLLLSQPSKEAIYFIRQISRFSKKIFEVCSDDYVTKAFQRFIEVDREVGQLSASLPYPNVTEVAQALFGKDIGSIFNDGTEIRFKHGPGAVAEKFDSIEKYSFQTLSADIVALVGIDPFRYSYAMMEDFHLDVIPARLIAVPKTATKPRLIAIEPSYNQFIQQGYHTLLMNRLSRSPIWSYASQIPNQDLARRGSIDGSYSTIDLSDASDRVSYRYVIDMFGFNKNFVEVLKKSRSTFVDIPGYGTRALHKFACMGSSLTFPLEVMYFSSIIGVAVGVFLKDSRTASILRYLKEHEVRVYGDDIIVPTDLTPTLMHVLEEFGLVVNKDKSFYSGLFRESCGADYYGGTNVTPIYLRRNLPSSRHHVDSLLALTAFRDQLHDRHLFENAVSVLDQVFESLGVSSIPENAILPSAATYRSGKGNCKVRWNKHLQRHEALVLVPSYKRKRTGASDDAILFKALYEGFNEDKLALSHGGRPVSASLKYRWVRLDFI